MFIVGMLSFIALVLGVLAARHHRGPVTLLTVLVVPLLAVGFSGEAGAAIVPTIGLGTAANFSVLAGSTVTNTGPTILQHSLGLSPGSSVTGFPPGTVVPPATQQIANGVAVQAKSDLTAAYTAAEGRPLNATTGADLAGLTLQGGVYAATTTKGALGLTGTVTLDGANNSSSVWIFQTDSTLTTGSGAAVRLINGASACNVFWQVGSSATLGTGTSFVGTVMALTSITLQSSVTVNGRALARNGAVTMINDRFIGPSCRPAPTTTTTAPTTTTLAPSTTAGGASTTQPGATTTQPGASTTQRAPAPTLPAAPPTLPAPVTTVAAANGIVQAGATTTAPAAGAPGVTTPRTGGQITGAGATPAAPALVQLPKTGRDVRSPALLAALAFSLGGLSLGLSDRLRTRASR